MAVTKHALIRYKILDNCFRNTGKRYFIDDLIDECSKVLAEMDPNSNGISRRQILDDISFMESSEGWSIDLERTRDSKKVFYWYKDRSFSINDMPLNEVEIDQLRAALNILSQFKGMPEFEWIHELIPKLKQGISSVDELPAIMEFDNNAYLKGIDNLGMLYNAIFYKKVVNINYHPYKNETPSIITLHPYYLKQYNNRWFLFGYNPENGKYDWNLALDRIIEIQEIKGKYQQNNKIEWSEYFEDFIGVTKPDNGIAEKITLHFYGDTGKYMETKPIHGSQKQKWLDAKTLEVNLELMLNYEFERFILSYADSVKVISPKKIQTVINKRLIDATKLY